MSADFSVLGQEIRSLDTCDCEYIHIDVMDGHFVPNLTNRTRCCKIIKKIYKKIFDVHLMIDPSKKFLPDFIEAGSDIITIHHEISENVFECIDFVKKRKKNRNFN